MSYFNEAYYMQSKVSQLIKDNFPSPDGETWTVSKLEAVLQSQGLTPQQHYELYGIGENLNPNPYFNQHEYLQAKADQVNSISVENPYGNRAWTVEDVLAAIKDNGMTAAEHYERYGAYETDASGNFINPSNAFDANAYYSAKLLQTRESGATVNGKTGNDISLDDIVQALQENDLSPTAHYMEYGADEANTFKIPMVQTVPMDSRVENDPAREKSGETVPGNYNQPTPPPAKSTPKAVTKPADMGDLASDAISPPVVNPDANLPVPGDTGYQSPPANIVDTNDAPVIPPSTTGSGDVTDNWIVTKPDGSGTVIDSDGTIIGTLPPGSIDDDGNITEPVEPVKPVTATATAGTDSLTFHDGVADTFITQFGAAGTPGAAEVQKIALTDAGVTAGQEYTLSAGGVSITATPSAGTVASLVTALNANIGNAPFTITSGPDGLTLSYSGTGAQPKATLTQADAVIGESAETTPGKAGVPEVQELAFAAADVKAGNYVVKLGSDIDITVALETGDANSLSALAAKIQAGLPGGSGITVTSNANGLVFTWGEDKAVTDMFTMTAPEATTITATEATKGVAEAKPYVVTIPVTTVTVGTYSLDLDGPDTANATQVTVTTASLQGLADAINTALGSTVNAAVVDGGITLTYENPVTPAPVVSLTRDGVSVEATDTTPGAAGTSAVENAALSGVTLVAYTLTVHVPGEADPVVLTATPGATTLTALANALTGAAGYDDTKFTVAVNQGENGLTITYAVPGEVSTPATLTSSGGSAVVTTTTPGVDPVDEVQTLALTAADIQPSETYTLTVYDSEGTPHATTVTTQADTTTAAQFFALIEASFKDGQDWTITNSGDNILVNYKTGGTRDQATLTSDSSTPIDGSITQEQAVQAAEVQTFDYAVSALEAGEYTFTLGAETYTLTLTDTFTVTALNTLLSAGYPDAKFTFKDEGGKLAAEFTAAEGDIPDLMTMSAPSPTELTAVQSAEGAPGVPEVQTLDIIGTLENGSTYVLTNGTEHVDVVVNGTDANALKTALDTDAIRQQFHIDTIAVTGDDLQITFATEADEPALSLTTPPATPISATTTVAGSTGTAATSSLSTLANMDTIYDFGFGQDTIQVGAAITALAKGTLTGITAQDFAAKAGTGQVGANEAGLFSYDNDYYLLVNNSNPDFDPSQDIVIKLTGISAAEVAAATLSDIFG